MNRALSAILLVLLVVLGAAYAASPLYAFHQLKRAAETGDRDRLNALVDFPGVREDLKRQVDSGAVKLAREASGVGYPIAMILGKLGASIGDRAIDRLVTPEAISVMVRTGVIPHKHKHADAPAGGEGAAPASDAATAAPQAAETPKVVTRFAYLTPDRFRVAVSPADHTDKAIDLIMVRQGLFSWRLEQIELPKK